MTLHVWPRGVALHRPGHRHVVAVTKPAHAIVAITVALTPAARP